MTLRENPKHVREASGAGLVSAAGVVAMIGAGAILAGGLAGKGAVALLDPHDDATTALAAGELGRTRMPRR